VPVDDRAGSAAAMVQIPVRLRFWDRPPTHGTAVILERSFGQRMGRALTQLLIFWGLALVSVLIPIAHFVLVPGFFVAGIIAARFRVQEERTLLTVSAICPRCESKQKFAPNTRFEPGKTISCPGCKNDLVVEEESEAA
jgi:hypothetical protein